MRITGTLKPNWLLSLVCLAGLAGIFQLSRHWNMKEVFLFVLLLTGFVILRNTGRLQLLLGKLENLFTSSDIPQFQKTGQAKPLKESEKSTLL